MATLEQLETALINADASGAVDDARALAAEISKRKSKNVVATGSILPLSKDATGRISFDSNAGIVGSLKRGLTLPGDVLRGDAKLPSSGSVPGSVPFDDPESAGSRVAELAGIAAPVNPAIRAGDRAIPGIANALTARKPVVPTTQELYDAGTRDFKAARDSGLELASNAVVEFSRRAQQKLYESGIHPVDAANTFAKLKALEDAPAGSVATASNLKSLRDSLRNTAQNFNPQAAKDQLASSRVIGELDEFVRSVDPKAVLAGNPSVTANLWQRGRGNYAAAQRSNDITGELDTATTGILERAEARAQAANSGRNLDNTIRSKVASALERPKEISGYSEAEVVGLEKVRDGGVGRNTARYIGNLLGGGGGMGQAVTGGVGALGGFAATGGNPVGAALGATVPPIAGSVSKAIANALAKKDLRAVDELIRQRSPLYADRVENPEMYLRNPELRAALVRALMETGAPRN